MLFILLHILVAAVSQQESVKAINMLQSEQDQYLPDVPEDSGEAEQQQCHFNSCCKQKADSVVSECFLLGPVLSGVLAFALLNKKSSSPTPSGNCTVSTLVMTNAVETVSTFVTTTVTRTTTSTSTAMTEVVSVLLVTAMSTGTVNTIVEAPTVTVKLTVTSIVTVENTVRTIKVSLGNNSCSVVKREIHEKMIERGLVLDNESNTRIPIPTAVLQLQEPTQAYSSNLEMFSAVSRSSDIEPSFSSLFYNLEHVHGTRISTFPVQRAHAGQCNWGRG